LSRSREGKQRIGKIQLRGSGFPPGHIKIEAGLTGALKLFMKLKFSLTELFLTGVMQHGVLRGWLGIVAFGIRRVGVRYLIFGAGF
jgi:hypothetical protein